MIKEQRIIALEVIQIVNQYFNTDCTILSRKADIVRPRMFACKLMRDVAKLNLDTIGDTFELSHDTVIHSLKVINKDIKNMPKWNRHYYQLIGLLESSEEFKKTTTYADMVLDRVRSDIYNIIMTQNYKQLNETLEILKQNEY